MPLSTHTDPPLSALTSSPAVNFVGSTWGIRSAVWQLLTSSLAAIISSLGSSLELRADWLPLHLSDSNCHHLVTNSLPICSRYPAFSLVSHPIRFLSQTVFLILWPLSTSEFLLQDLWTYLLNPSTFSPFILACPSLHFSRISAQSWHPRVMFKGYMLSPFLI